MDEKFYIRALFDQQRKSEARRMETMKKIAESQIRIRYKRCILLPMLRQTITLPEDMDDLLW